MTNEKDIIKIITEDKWMMNILRAVKSLNLPDWWICAGFVRSKIWDNLHGFTVRTPLPDIDVIYFSKEAADKMYERSYELMLNKLLPGLPWSVKNQARMHVMNNMASYSSSVDAISKFPETATSVGVKLDDKERVILTAPWGLSDLMSLEVKPTSYFLASKEGAAIYEERVLKKNWKTTWDKITIHHTDII